MSREPKHTFNWRALVSVTTAVSFLVMSITGVVLFFTPRGRVAHWVEWRMLGLTKDQWGALHIWFSLVFLVMAAFHIYFNWRSLLNYFRNKIRRTYAVRREWVLSLIICAIVFVGTLANLTPFSSLLVWNELLKDSWEVPGQQAPIPHAELMTLAEIADKVKGLDTETMITNLGAKGIEVKSAHVILGELAQKNNLAPSQLYAIAVGPGGAGEGSKGYLPQGCRGGYGVGQLTLRQYCDRVELDISKAAEKLRDKDIQAEPDMLLRDIAHTAGVHASDIQDILEE
jgi:hypothetical protein